MLCREWAVELGPDNIRVNVICPAAISTEIADDTEADNEDVKIPVEYPRATSRLPAGSPVRLKQSAI